MVSPKPHDTCARARFRVCKTFPLGPALGGMGRWAGRNVRARALDAVSAADERRS